MHGIDEQAWFGMHGMYEHEHGMLSHGYGMVMEGTC